MRLRACSILRSAESMKLWPPKPGLTLMIRMRSMSSITQSSTSRRGRRVEHQPGLAARRLDGLDAAVHVRRSVGVEADVVGARLRESRGQRVDRLDHQMHVDGHRRAVGRLRVRLERLADHRPEGQVRHVVVVHHVEMDPVGAGGDRRCCTSSPRRAKSAERMEGAMRKVLLMRAIVAEDSRRHACRAQLPCRA